MSIRIYYLFLKHWVPEYVGTEIKKMGIHIDGNGNLINQNE